jgi:hypothetical protein
MRIGVAVGAGMVQEFCANLVLASIPSWDQLSCIGGNPRQGG